MSLFFPQFILFHFQITHWFHGSFFVLQPLGIGGPGLVSLVSFVAWDKDGKQMAKNLTNSKWFTYWTWKYLSFTYHLPIQPIEFRDFPASLRPPDGATVSRASSDHWGHSLFVDAGIRGIMAISAIFRLGMIICKMLYHFWKKKMHELLTNGSKRFYLK